MVAESLFAIIFKVDDNLGVAPQREPGPTRFGKGPTSFFYYAVRVFMVALLIRSNQEETA